MAKTKFVDFKAVKAAITMEQVLDHYGLMDKFKRGADSLNGPCPIHNGSNQTQFRVSVSKNIWHCFSECKHGGNVLEFIEKMRQELHQFYGSKEQVAVRLKDAQKHLTDTEQELTALQRDIQKVRDEMNHMMKLSMEGHITTQGFGQFYKPAEERLNQLLAGLPKLEADMCRLKVDRVSVEEVIHEARNLYQQWPKMSAQQKRPIVEAIFEKVEIGEGKINITYSGLPSSEELCKSQQQMAPVMR